MVQVRSGDYHIARWAYSLDALQDLDAIANAVYHATGQRIRWPPITVERLLCARLQCLWLQVTGMCL
jgi:hypothetical protein